MKKIIITIISIALVLLLLFNFMGKAKTQSVEKIKINEIDVDINSETIQKLYAIVNQKDDLRKASLNNESLDDDTIIKYIMVNLTRADYSEVPVGNVKVICEAAPGIRFNSDHYCAVRIISLAKMDEFKKKLFNIDRPLNYKNFEYRGLDCRSNGVNYYCNMNSYNDTSVSFSVLNKATKYNDELYLYEHYLKINLDDMEDCSKYFSKDYCSDYKNKEMPLLVDEVITNKGVYYRHVFKLGENNNYYLKSSSIFVE